MELEERQDPKIAEYAQVFIYLQVASMIVLLYDFTLTFSREADLIWNRRRGLVGVLHFVIRVFSFLDNGLIFTILFSKNASPKECKHWLTAQTWIFFVEYFAVEGIFIIRTYAIWDNSRQIGLGLLTLLISLESGVAVLVNSYINSVEFSIGSGCSPSKFSSQLWIIYLILLVHESAILIFTLVKTLRHRRYNSSSLFQTIFRDGISYYMCIFVMSVINIAFLNLVSHFSELSFGLSPLHRNLNAILCIRLMFNIRKAADQGGLKQQQRRIATDSGILVEREVAIALEPKIKENSEQDVDRLESGDEILEPHFLRDQNRDRES